MIRRLLRNVVNFKPRSKNLKTISNVENLEFKIKTVGTLKYSRLESLSILRKEINSFGYEYTMVQAKNFLDSILNNAFNDRFNLEFKFSIDKIISDMEYIKYDNSPIEQNFPDNWISPIG